MKIGVFALFDCLGFKGIWKDEGGYAALMSKLKSISSRAESAAIELAFPEGVPDGNTRGKPEVKLLSDTVAISLSSGSESKNFADILTMTNIIRALIDLYLEEPPCLVLRGCITYGKYEIAENFLVGPAVDEAAECMDSAEGAFIWFLPTVNNIVESYCDTNKAALQGKLLDVLDMFFPTYSIPIKNSHYLLSRAVNPCYGKSEEDSEKTVNLYKEAMKVGENMSIWMKRQNTVEFLRSCEDKNAELLKILAAKQ